MVRNRKLMLMSGGVLAGAAALAMAADALLRSSVQAPAAQGVYTLPASWMVRGGGEEAPAVRAPGLGNSGPAGVASKASGGGRTGE